MQLCLNGRNGSWYLHEHLGHDNEPLWEDTVKKIDQSVSRLLQGERASWTLFVAGAGYYDCKNDISLLLPRTPLFLRRQPDNPYDPNAVEIFLRNGAKVGYVPRTNSQEISQILNGGTDLWAQVTEPKATCIFDISIRIFKRE